MLDAARNFHETKINSTTSVHLFESSELMHLAESKSYVYSLHSFCEVKTSSTYFGEE